MKKLKENIKKNKFIFTLFIVIFISVIFRFYNYENRWGLAYSLPLVLFLDVEGKLDKQGYKIGFGNPSYLDRLPLKEIRGNKMGFDLWDLEINSRQTLKKEKWSLVNPSEIYKATEEWYTKK